MGRHQRALKAEPTVTFHFTPLYIRMCAESQMLKSLSPGVPCSGVYGESPVNNLQLARSA